jgi:hypothetical protein
MHHDSLAPVTGRSSLRQSDPMTLDSSIIEDEEMIDNAVVELHFLSVQKFDSRVGSVRPIDDSHSLL